ncbi:efflux RND transporter periplasmic adaptor subunit [Martelella radicis]|uniref:RND family efflux transporter MFP subunit n=1 Tax=Martelella radicis TaxID=1397476 RepID=A0A7W6KP73_9HYPH|nr:efflux RND transporter periplasmic adaptor subunit [Martelella radicis]MBB4123500.1 RND family efflux transporter MFP subunit [Martelella radicis]
MRFYQQVAVSVCLLAIGSAAWLFLAPGGRAVLTSYGVLEAEPAAGSGGRPPGGFSGGGIQVVTAPVTTGTVNDELTAIGSGEAIRSVTVLPEEAGTITELNLSSGDMVEKGEVIAVLDDREQVLARNLAEVALESATRQAEVNRRIKSAISDLEVYNAEIAERSAELDLEAAELDLSRRRIVAPIDGIAGIVAVNVGDYVTTSSEIVTIDDRSSILVDFSVPERFATAIRSGAPVEASLVSAPQQVFEGEVQAVDNRIDAASRTFMVRARLDNEDDALRAGMSFDVSMRFPGDVYPAVDPLSIQWDSDGAYVWQLVDGKSTKTRVRIIQRDPDVVLVDAQLGEGDSVIIEGIQRLREGASVSDMTSGAPQRESAGSAS